MTGIMRTSDQINELAKALATAEGVMKNAPLNKQNPHFKSRYADLAGIRDTVTPALSAYGIAVIQGTGFVDGSLVVITRLVHLSGQWIESLFPIAMGKPQEMGSAYTYARRYSLAAMCNIAAEDDDDANGAGEAKPEAANKAIDDTQFRYLSDLVEKAGADESKVLAFVGCDRMEDLTQAQFKKLEAALRSKITKNGNSHATAN